MEHVLCNKMNVIYPYTDALNRGNSFAPTNSNKLEFTAALR